MPGLWGKMTREEAFDPVRTRCRYEAAVGEIMHRQAHEGIFISLQFFVESSRHDAILRTEHAKREPAAISNEGFNQTATWHRHRQ